MNKCLLLTRPDHDRTTRYLSAWADDLVKEADRKNNKVLDLKKNKANRSDLESRVRKNSPSLFILFGHGDENQVTGQDNCELVLAGENHEVLANAVSYAVSCKAAQNLGRIAVASGARAFIGYTEDYVFIFDESKRTQPRTDKTAALFLSPSNQVGISLIKGHTAGEAHGFSRLAYLRNITKLLHSEVTPDQTAAIPWLYWDAKHQVCLGDPNATM